MSMHEEPYSSTPADAQAPGQGPQFLIEALTLSLIGGGIGLLFGLLMGWAMTVSLAIPLVITPESLVLPVVLSAGVEVFFGSYPAVRAVRLDPIEALRSL
jgi:putative ABC transport system permease protein